MFAVIFIHSFLADATTYYTTGVGDWADNIWGTNTNGTGSAFPSLSAGDTVYIDDNITLNSPGGVTISVDVTIIVDAWLDIEKILQLTASSILFVTSNGSVTASGSGSSTKIRFGNGQAQWDSSDPPLIGPGILDENSDGALPIELIYFEATKSNERTNLSWATASEENFDYFEIQRAVGSTEFESIGEIPGTGKDSYEIREYAFLDEKPMNGLNYYRLKSIDLDGTFEYSPIQSLKFDFDSRFEVYPNPSNGYEINMLIDDFDKMEAFGVYDNKGFLIHKGQITGHDDTYILRNLKSGLYLIKLIGLVESRPVKMVVL